MDTSEKEKRERKKKEMDQNRPGKEGKNKHPRTLGEKNTEDKQIYRKDIRKMKNPSNGRKETERSLYIHWEENSKKKEPSQKDTLISKHHIDGVKTNCKSLQEKRAQAEGFEPKSTS